MRNMVIVDKDSNQEIGPYSPRRKRRKAEAFGQIYFVPFSESCRITNTDSFTLEMRLMAVMDSSNLFVLNDATKDRILKYGMPKERKHLWRGLKRLIKIGVVTQTQNKNEYMLNPNYFSRTGGEKRQVNISIWDRLVTMHANNRIETATKTKRKPKKHSKQSKTTNNEAHIFDLRKVE